MVDVGAKRPSRRRAVASGRVLFNRAAFEQLRDDRLPKGAALSTARLAGIQAAKRTADLIPLCHTIPLDHVEVEIRLDEKRRSAEVTATAAARWTTGVEMEALAAVSVACLTLYDMAKAIDRGIAIQDVMLQEKEGGRSGHFKRGRPRR